MTWKRAPVMTGVLGVMLACGLAQAGPPVLDRIPTNSGMVVAVPSLERFEAAAKRIESIFGEEGGPFDDMKKILGAEGLNMAGSAGFAFVPGPDGALDFDAPIPPIVVLVPVTNYAAFVGGLGGEATGIAEIQFEGEEDPAFVKDVGNGYAALGPVREIIEAFQGQAGQAAAHTKMLGATGNAIADNSDIVFIANLPALEPQMREGMESMHQSMEEMAMMTGQEMGGSIAILDTIMGGLIRDGQSAVIGFSSKESGFGLDLAGQFKEGSPTAAYFNARGSASPLFSRLPSQPYLFAVAVDTSAPGIKSIFKAASELSLQGEGAEENAGMIATMLKTIETMQGTAFQWGASQAMMGGGLFTNAIAYVKTADPAGYTGAMQQAFTDMNGKTMSGFTYQTAYKAGSKDVSGVMVDEWSMRMMADPNDPNAQQVQMMQMGMFGMEGGPSGYIAPADGGVVMTYSKNSELMAKGLTAAKGDGGMAADPGLKMVGAMLPADRTVEAYIGVKDILNMVMGFMPMEVQVPPDLPPIGVGGTMNQGAVRFSTFVPLQVVETLKQLEQGPGDPGMGEDLPPPEDDAGQPS